MSELLRGADVVHLTFRPPFAVGSYTSLVGALLDDSPSLRQVAISYGDGPVPAAGPGRSRTVLVGEAGTSAFQSAVLRLPERVRRLAPGDRGDIMSADRLHYAHGVLAALGDEPPPVIVVWDDYKLGRFLRRALGRRTTIVLSQHGRTYHLMPEAARDVYRLDSFDAVVTLTRSSYQADREQLYAYEPLVLVRPNGVDPEVFRPVAAAPRAAAKASWGLPTDAVVVLALARLAPSKGVHLLLHSWPRVLEQAPDAVLWIVGGGTEDQQAYGRQLVETAANLGLGDRVRFEGRVDRERVPACHAAADLYVLPTVQDEGHPLSLVEAMSSGLACVASDSPVTRELHSGAVELVPDPNTEDAFVAPLVRLVQDDAERRELGAAARAQVLDRFTLDGYRRDLGDFFARLIAARAGGPSGTAEREKGRRS